MVTRITIYGRSRSSTRPTASSTGGYTYYHIWQVSLEYSSNGQQYTEEELLFAYYRPPALSSASPSSGPLAGSTDVRLAGAELRGRGSHPVCAFGTAAPVPASRDGGPGHVGSVRCTAPADAGSEAPLRFSLNAQQYSPPLPEPFRQYAPLTISQLTPDSGPASGGQSQTVTDSNRQ